MGAFVTSFTHKRRIVALIAASSELRLCHVVPGTLIVVIPVMNALEILTVDARG